MPNRSIYAFFRGETAALEGRLFGGGSGDLGATWRIELLTMSAEIPGQARVAVPYAVENVNRPGERLVYTTERGKRGNTQGCVGLWRGDATKPDWTREKVLLEFPNIDGFPNPDFGSPWLMFNFHVTARATCPMGVTEIEL